jgi:hypothetical protein
MVDEFADHRFGAEAGIELELVERLHRPKPGDAAPPARTLAPCAAFGCARARAQFPRP